VGGEPAMLLEQAQHHDTLAKG